MRSALAKTKVPVEYVVYEKEGHGFLLEENRFDFWRRVEKFLAENLK
jgi:dipeptidyl aminopeptidase/acylaminoacyl peptidase